MRKGRQGLWAGLLAVLVVVPVAAAAEAGSPLEEFVNRAEPICKTNVLANKRIFKGAKGEVKQGELKKASAHFFRAATAFKKTIRQLNAIPKPPEYEAKLVKWLDLLKDVNAQIEKIGRALAADQKRKAESYSVELDRNSRKANNSVLLFGFNYCRLDSSRFE